MKSGKKRKTRDGRGEEGRKRWWGRRDKLQVQCTHYTEANIWTQT